MKKIVFITVVLVVCILSLNVSARNSAGVMFKDSSIDQALAIASNEDKPVFVFCYSSNSTQSNIMLNRHFFNPEIADYFNGHFLNLKVNVLKKEGEKFSSKYNVQRYPSIYFINTNGIVISTYVGNINEDELLTFGENVMETYTAYRGFPQKIKDGEYSMNELNTFLRLEGNYPEAESLVNEKLVEVDEEMFLSTTTLELTGTYINDFHLPSFNKIIKDEDRFLGYVGDDYFSYIHRVFTNYLEENPDSLQNKKMAIWQFGHPTGKMAYYDYELLRARQELQLLIAAHEKRKLRKNEKEAIKSDYISQVGFWLENRDPDATRIMHEVTFICENEFIKDEQFEVLTQTLVSRLYEVGNQKFWNYYTDAIFQNSVGNKKKAETLMLKAIQDIQKSDPSNFRTLHWFRTKLDYM